MQSRLMCFLCATALFFACSEQNELLPDMDPQLTAEESSVILEDGAFVSVDQATRVAKFFFCSKTDEKTLTKTDASSLKSSASVEMISEDQHPLMYILNYPEGGFAIVSATRNYYPVLAYSDEGSFVLSDMDPATGWMEETKEAIRISENYDDETKSSIHRMWDVFEMEESQALSGSSLKSSDPMADAFAARMRALYLQYGPLGWSYFVPLSGAQTYLDSNDYSYLCSLANSLGSPLQYTIVILKTNTQYRKVGELLPNVVWHQGSPYNSVCNSHGYDAGCGSVAMAMIMKFHKYPPTLICDNHTINWNNLSNNGNPVGSIPYLITATGRALNTIYTSLGSCALPSQVDNAFRFFGYTVSDRSYSYDEVRAELLGKQRPVMMFGSPNDLYINSHYWVCDGVDDVQYTTNYFMEFINPGSYTFSTQGYSSPSNPRTSQTLSSSYLHMNWGWANGSNNGWYYYSNVNTSVNNYSHLRENFFVGP